MAPVMLLLFVEMGNILNLKALWSNISKRTASAISV